MAAVARQPVPALSQAVYQRISPKMRVTSQRVIIRVSHKMPSTITTSEHTNTLRRTYTTFWHLKMQKGSAPADRGQAKSKRGEWVKQCEIPGRDPTQSPKLPHQRPTVSLQANIKLGNYT